MDFPPKPEALFHRRNQAGTGGGVPRGKQRHLMAPLDQPLGEVVNNPLRAPYFFGGTLSIRGNLRNSKLFMEVAFSSF